MGLSNKPTIEYTKKKGKKRKRKERKQADVQKKN